MHAFSASTNCYSPHYRAMRTAKPLLRAKLPAAVWPRQGREQLQLPVAQGMEILIHDDKRWCKGCRGRDGLPRARMERARSRRRVALEDEGSVAPTEAKAV